MKSLWIALSSRVLWVALAAALGFCAILAILAKAAREAAEASRNFAWLFPDPETYAESLAVAAVTVFVTGFLGSILKVVLDVVGLEKEARDQRLRFLQNTLDDVKAVEDRLQRTRVVILAHRSVKTYGSEMRDLIQARVTVLNIERAYRLTAFDFPEPFRGRIRASAVKMIAAFDMLINEFQTHYKQLSILQRIHESKFDKALGGASDTAEVVGRARYRDSIIWEELGKLPELRRLLPHYDDKKESASYTRRFGRHVDDLTRELRIAMSATLEGRESLLDIGEANPWPLRKRPPPRV